VTAREKDLRMRLRHWTALADEWEKLIAEKTERGMRCDVEERLLAAAQKYVLDYVEQIMQIGEAQ